MAFKLSKDDIKRRDNLISEAQSSEAEIESEVESFNNTLQNLIEEFQAKLLDYNEKRASLKEFMDEKQQEFQEQWDSKSEKWQEGDRAQAATDWINLFSEYDLDEIEYEFPEGLEFDIEPAFNALSEMQNEPSCL